MAQIYSIVGEYDLAIDELEYVLSIPSWCTPALLRADPIFAPMQELPRFVALLEKYDSK
ncbi:MAG: hypothetical protein OEV49_05220 [candidate division Zixibacteria bacterium]|nr:hypothetical protein [candidate division Zixibacteria bacterium]MDH4032378.1 hypothetical protein [candidate division Zixibacteria bacterium]